jgi:hypothetical protein
LGDVVIADIKDRERYYKEEEDLKKMKKPM